MQTYIVQGADTDRNSVQKYGSMIFTDERKQVIINAANYTLKHPWPVPAVSVKSEQRHGAAYLEFRE